MIVARQAAEDDAGLMAQVHATAFLRPWDADVFRAFLRERAAFGSVVESADGRGLVLCRAMAGEAEVLTLAVEPTAQRRGLGAILLTSAIKGAREASAQTLFLEVAPDNVAAVALYARAGFVEVGRRRAYYSRPTGAVDALVLRRDLNR